MSIKITVRNLCIKTREGRENIMVLGVCNAAGVVLDPLLSSLK